MVVKSALSFLRPQNHKPEVLSAALTGGAAEYLFEADEITVPIYDMRARGGTLSVDREGFELLSHTSAVHNLYDDAAVGNQYYAEIEAFLGQRFGASRVVIFDATRRSDGDVGAKNPDGQRGPAKRVHVDYTAGSAPQRVKDVLGKEEAKRLKKSGARIIQINVWRPITGPVRRAPLALADASSIRPSELVATDQIFPDRIGEIYYLTHNPEQRWFFAPQMTRDEVLLIKGWDSALDGRAQFTPHTAFDLPNSETAPPRESIELRTLVVIE